MDQRSALAPLAQPRFRSLWLASIAGNLGSLIQGVAGSWLMLLLTDSPVWVGAMAASSTLPVLFFGLIAGALADLADRKKILIVSQLGMGGVAAAMAVLAYTDELTAPVLLILGLALGVGVAFNLPAYQAMVPDLVPRAMVPSAVALNSVAFNVARAVGPAIGGIIVAGPGPELAFLLNAVSYLGVVAVVARFPSANFEGDDAEPMGTAIAVGLRYVRFTTLLRRLVLVASAFAITGAAVQAVLPNLTREALDGGAGLYGLLLGAMGTGALFGAVSRRRATERLGRWMVPLSIIGFGTAGVIVGLSRVTSLTVVAMIGSGVFWVWTLSTLNASVQLLSPDWVRGRTMSVYLLSFVGIMPLGSLLAGALGDMIGVGPAVVALSAAGVLLGMSATRARLPALDEVRSPEPPADWERSPHDVAIAGGPVMVVNTWIIDEHDLADYLQAMRRVRLVRLRTGAYRWRLYRNAGDPHRMTEVMVLPSWEDHLRQHRRIDADAVEVLRHARSFDRADGPVTRHLVAIDITDPEAEPEWEELQAVHRDLHGVDGSIPIVEVEARYRD